MSAAEAAEGALLLCEAVWGAEVLPLPAAGAWPDPAVTVAAEGAIVDVLCEEGRIAWLFPPWKYGTARMRPITRMLLKKKTELLFDDPFIGKCLPASGESREEVALYFEPGNAHSAQRCFE